MNTYAQCNTKNDDDVSQLINIGITYDQLNHHNYKDSIKKHNHTKETKLIVHELMLICFDIFKFHFVISL